MFSINKIRFSKVIKLLFVFLTLEVIFYYRESISYHFRQNEPIINEQDVCPPVLSAGISQLSGEALENRSRAQEGPNQVEADNADQWGHKSKPSKAYVTEESGHSLFEYGNGYVSGHQSRQEEEVTDGYVSVEYELCGQLFAETAGLVFEPIC